jgi:hypothetical protein
MNMNQRRHALGGEFLFRTKDGNKAVVYLSQGKGTFTLRRVMSGGSVDERSNIDVYRGNIDGYISEAMLEWSDLERDGVEWKAAR